MKTSILLKAVLMALILVVMAPIFWCLDTASDDCTLDDSIRAQEILCDRGVKDAFYDLFGGLNERQTLHAAQICLDFEQEQRIRSEAAFKAGLITQIPTPVALNMQIIDTAAAIKATGSGNPNVELQNTNSSKDKWLAGIFIRLLLDGGETAIVRHYPGDYVSGGTKVAYLPFQQAIDALELEGEAEDKDVVLIVTEANPFTATAKIACEPGAHEGVVIRTVNGATGIKWFDLRFEYDQAANIAKYGKTFMPIIDASVNAATFCITTDLNCNVRVSGVDLVNEGDTSAVQFRFCNVYLDDITSSAQLTTFIDIPDLLAGQVIDFKDVRINGVASGRGIHIYDSDLDGTFIGEGLNISGTFSLPIHTWCNTSITNSNVSGNNGGGIRVDGYSMSCANTNVAVNLDNVVIDGNSSVALMLSFVQDDAGLGETMPSGASATVANCRIRSNGGGAGAMIDGCGPINFWRNNIGKNNVGIVMEETAGDFAQNIITQNDKGIVTNTISDAVWCSQGLDTPVPNLGDDTWCGVNIIADTTSRLIDNNLNTMLTAHGNWYGDSALPNPSVYMEGNVDLGTSLPNPPKAGAVGEIELSFNPDGVNIDIVDINWADPPPGSAEVYYGTDPSQVSAYTTAFGVMVDGLYQYPVDDGNVTTFFKRKEIEPYFDPDTDPCPGDTQSIGTLQYIDGVKSYDPDGEVWYIQWKFSSADDQALYADGPARAGYAYWFGALEEKGQAVFPLTDISPGVEIEFWDQLDPSNPVYLTGNVVVKTGNLNLPFNGVYHCGEWDGLTRTECESFVPISLTGSTEVPLNNQHSFFLNEGNLPSLDGDYVIIELADGMLFSEPMINWTSSGVMHINVTF
ncbi:right-handed parallel beta-helix repeat-containing protein [Patescibacteria group bacterium]